MMAVIPASLFSLPFGSTVMKSILWPVVDWTIGSAVSRSSHVMM